MTEYTDGEKLWRTTDCKHCKGTGRTWYPGCGDQSAPCSDCDGIGQTASYRIMQGGEATGPWRSWSIYDC